MCATKFFRGTSVAMLMLLIPSSTLALTAEENLAIMTTVNAYSLSVDSRPLPESFAHIFTEDAECQFQMPSPISGLAAIEEYLHGFIPNFYTMHSFGTQAAELVDSTDPEGRAMAVATTYNTGTFWGMGNKSYDYIINFSKYVDQLILTDDGWKIYNKSYITVTPSYGNLSYT